MTGYPEGSRMSIALKEGRISDDTPLFNPTRGSLLEALDALDAQKEEDRLNGKWRNSDSPLIQHVNGYQQNPE